MSRAALCAGLLVVTLCSLQGAGWAARARVSVLPFGGKGGAEVGHAVSKSLKAHGYTLVSVRQFRSTAARLAATVEGPEALGAIAAELRLTSIVLGKVTETRRALTARIVVRDGRDGEVIGQATFSAGSGRKLARAVQKDLWKKLGRTFKRLPAVTDKPPPAATPADEEDPFAGAPEVSAPPEPALASEPTPSVEPPLVRRRVATPEPVTDDEPLSRGPPRFEVAVGPRMVFRQFTYASDPDDALSEFRTDRGAPSLVASLSAFVHLGFPRLGVTVSAEQGTPMSATASTGLTYNTFSGDYFGAVLVGLPGRRLVVDLSLGGGRQRFALLPQGAAASRPRPVPNVTYDYLRGGLSLHYYTDSPFRIFAGGYYRHVLLAGTIRSVDWFPSAQVWGAEGTVGVGYRFLSWCEARLHGDVRIYRFRMSPGAGDAHVTDGALDQYWSGSLSLAALFGGGAR